MPHQPEFVRYEVADGVGTITLDRPPLNAYDPPPPLRARAGVDAGCGRSRRRVVVLRATGKHFCAGASSDGDPRPASAGADPRALRQAKRAVNTTMDIQGQHYIRNRFAELMDASPRLKLGRE